MPRVSFSAENKVATTNYDFPRLKLKQNERARILVGLEDPLVEYVHTLQKPEVINGVPTKIMKDRKDGSQYEDYKMTFVSRPICLGNPDILDEKGSDPKNCPACKLAKTNSDYTKAPQRRYAMHVIRYRTKAGTQEVAKPFSVELLVWSFTDRTFNKLIDFKEEWGDLRGHDILLGPCTNELFQQYDLSVSAKAEWLADEERKTLTSVTFNENQIPDLSIAAGSAKQHSWVEQDVQTILEAWGEVGSANDAEHTTQSLDEGLSSLLDSNGAQKEWAKSEPEAKDDEPEEAPKEDLLVSSIPAMAVEPEQTEEKAEAPAAAAAPPATNFDDLLSGLSS